MVKGRSLRSLFVGAVLLCASAWASAAGPSMRDRPVGVPAGVRNAPDYGTINYSVEQVFSYGFQGSNPVGDDITDNGNGYRWFTDPADSFLAISPVHIPSGVIIDYIGLNSCDTNASGAVTLVIYKSYGDNQFDTIGTVASTDSASCGYIYNVTPFDYFYDTNEANLLSLYVFLTNGVVDGSLRFRGVEVWYRRVVSPAPPTNTFGDVPTDHPFFRYIEALVASGITAGCGSGNYCPDSPLTRGQMAVFLSIALGLHFPN